jgi:hypothetical protein
MIRLTSGSLAALLSVGYDDTAFSATRALPLAATAIWNRTIREIALRTSAMRAGLTPYLVQLERLIRGPIGVDARGHDSDS